MATQRPSSGWTFCSRRTNSSPPNLARDIVFAAIADQFLGKALQNVIPRAMAEPVIDPLEMIHIRHDNAERRRQIGFQLRIKALPVAHACQQIVIGSLLKPKGQPMALPIFSSQRNTISARPARPKIPPRASALAGQSPGGRNKGLQYVVSDHRKAGDDQGEDPDIFERFQPKFHHRSPPIRCLLHSGEWLNIPGQRNTGRLKSKSNAFRPSGGPDRSRPAHLRVTLLNTLLAAPFAKP